MEKKSVRENIASNLKQLREAKGLTQSHVAKKFGLTQAAIARYESAITVPNEELILKFANFYNVSIDYLFANPEKGKKTHQVINFEIADLDDQLAKLLQEDTKTRKAIVKLLKNNNLLLESHRKDHRSF